MRVSGRPASDPVKATASRSCALLSGSLVLSGPSRGTEVYADLGWRLMRVHLRCCFRVNERPGPVPATIERQARIRRSETGQPTARPAPPRARQQPPVREGFPVPLFPP